MSNNQVCYDSLKLPNDALWLLAYIVAWAITSTWFKRTVYACHLKDTKGNKASSKRTSNSSSSSSSSSSSNSSSTSLASTRQLRARSTSSTARITQDDDKNAKATRHKNALKQAVSWYKLVSYLILIVFGVVVLSGEKEWLSRLTGWTISNPVGSNPLLQHWPNGIPAGIKHYYFIEVAYYLYNSVAMWTEPRMKDFWQMFIHHIVTLLLTLSSYWYW